MFTPVRAISLLLLLTAALYAPSAGYAFVYEDLNDFSTWSQHGSWIGETIQHPTRSLTALSYSIGQHMSDLEPWGYHVMSVLWHLVNGVLFACLAVQVIGGWPAVFAVGVFLLHPVQVESVAYISAQADLVSTGFILCALLAAEARYLWLAGVCCVLAVLGKETAVAALPLIAAWEVYRGRVSVRLALTVGVVAVLLGITTVAFHDYVRVDPWWIARIAQDGLGLLSLWVLPMPLTVYHDFSPLRIAITFGVVVMLGALSPSARVALLGAAIVWAPRLLVPQLEGMHEHHLYTVSLGLSLCAGLWLRTYAQEVTDGVSTVSATAL